MSCAAVSAEMPPLSERPESLWAGLPVGFILVVQPSFHFTAGTKRLTVNLVVQTAVLGLREKPVRD